MIEKNQIIYLLSHQNLMNIYGLNLTLYESFFVIAQSFFLLIKYSKRQKIKKVNLLCHTVTQGVFHQNHLENIFWLC